jgi:hypothetical protein
MLCCSAHAHKQIDVQCTQSVYTVCMCVTHTAATSNKAAAAYLQLLLSICAIMAVHCTTASLTTLLLSLSLSNSYCCCCYWQQLTHHAIDRAAIAR